MAGSRERPWAALGVTVAVPLALGALAYVPLPLLDPARRAMAVSARSGQGLAGLFDLVPPSLGLLALGLTPVISAFLVVELAAVAVPRWRPLRLGGPDGRRRLRRATWVLTFVLAAVQATGVALQLRGLGLAAAPGPVFVASTAGLLVLGTGAVLAGAWLVEARGLLGGFSTLLGAAALGQVVSGGVALLEVPSVALGPGGLLRVLVPQAVVVAGVAWILLRNRGGEASGAALPLPTSGLGPPIAFAATVLLAPASLASLLGRPGLAAFVGTRAWRVADLVLVAGAVIVFSVLFNRPGRVAALRRRLLPAGDAAGDAGTGPLGPALRTATLHSGVLVLGLVLAAGYAARYAPAGVPRSPVPLAVLTAVVLDGVAAWRARARGPRVAVWPLHRCHAVGPVLAALAEAGIDAEARGRHHRVLLQFFGPHVPVDVTVPPADAEAARAILAARLPEPSPAAEVPPPARPEAG